MIKTIFEPFGTVVGAEMVPDPSNPGHVRLRDLGYAGDVAREMRGGGNGTAWILHFFLGIVCSVVTMRDASPQGLGDARWLPDCCQIVARWFAGV